MTASVVMTRARSRSTYAVSCCISLGQFALFACSVSVVLPSCVLLFYQHLLPSCLPSRAPPWRTLIKNYLALVWIKTVVLNGSCYPSVPVANSEGPQEFCGRDHPCCAPYHVHPPKCLYELSRHCMD